MHRAVLLLSMVGLLIACGDTSRSAPTNKETPPATAEQPFKLDARDEGFRFGPTFTVHRPPGSELIPLAEVGLADRRSMQAMIAYANDQDPAVGLWRFEMGGDKDTLRPTSAPTPLLGLRPDDPIDTSALEELRVQMGAGHAVVMRPQGIDASSVLDALDVLNHAAQQVLDPKAPVAKRVEALARFTRGLDEDLLLSRTGLPTALATMEHPTRAFDQPDANERRVTFMRGGQRISMLRKSGGWVISGIESTR